MSLLKGDNRANTSSNKHHTMKSEHFRIKKKAYEHTPGKISGKPFSDNFHMHDTSTDPGQTYVIQSQYNHPQQLVQHMGPINQGPFRLDQRLLQRLHSYGTNTSSQIQFEASELGLSDFLQVKSVAFMNQDGWNKWKTMTGKPNQNQERNIQSPPKTKKLPSLAEHELAKEDEEYRKRHSCEANLSVTQGVLKTGTQEDRLRKDSGKEEFQNLKEYQMMSLTPERAQSESPIMQGKTGRVIDSSGQKTDRRNNSLTPRKETPSKVVRAEGLGGRFGPLEQIQEISMKRAANSYNYNPKSINNQTRSYQSNSSTTSTNNAPNNKNKIFQPNIVFVEKEKVTSAAEFTRTFLNIPNNNKNPLQPNVNPGLYTGNNNNPNFRTSPPSKIATVTYNTSSYKPANSGINAIQVEIENGINRALMLNSQVSNDVRRFQANQQNKNGRVFNTNVNLASYQQPNPVNVHITPYQPPNYTNINVSAYQQQNFATSNYVLTATMNPGQPFIQNQVVSNLMPNNSTLNLKQVYPTLKVEENPRKRVIYVPPPQSNKLKFFVGGGNNSALVKRVLAKRDWWEEIEVFGGLFNLKWQQTFRGYKYDRLPDKFGGKQLVNHFEFHPEISTKDKLVKNLSVYCDTNKVNLSEITPVTFCFDMDDTANFDRDMQKFAKFFIKHHPNDKKYPQPNANDKKSQHVWYNFDYRKRPAYMHPAPHPEKKPSPFLKPTMHNTFLKNTNAWVLKPVGLNRGRGIEVFNSLETLNELMNQCFQPTTVPNKKKTPAFANATAGANNNNNAANAAVKKEEGAGSGSEDDEEDLLKKELSATSRTFVIQKYIEDVLLINKRKFDIRVWTLITHDMQLYFFKEGYLRMSSEEFSLEGDEVFNKFIHLTNNAVQKFSNGYGQHELGNQLSFKDFEDYMVANGLEGDFRGKILPRMKELVKTSMLSVHKMLNQHDRKYCFEIFGYDFMIDAEFNVWLIEVNTNPCLDESSPLLHMLIPRMVDDAFKLSVDVIFPKPGKKSNTSAAAKTNINIRSSITSSITKDESQDTKSTAISSNLREVTPEEKKFEPEVIEDNKEQNIEPKEEKEDEKATTEIIEGHLNIISEAEILNTEKNIEIQNIPIMPESVETRAETASKDQSSTKASKVDESPSGHKELIFSVEGYSDTENMWELLCSLYVPKSPNKRDNKAR